MGPSELGFRYLLLLKDDLSGYLWLVHARTSETAQTVEEFLSWFTAFCVVTTWVTDRGSLFASQVVKTSVKLYARTTTSQQCILHGQIAP
jgi:hypothetical protein